MWLRCHQCERTTLCLEASVPSPYRCRACRETHPNRRPRQSRAALADLSRSVRLGEFVDTSREVVIDVTPTDGPISAAIPAVDGPP